MKVDKRKKKLDTIEDSLYGLNTIFIKTYLFESGLFYLSKSLGEHLETLGKNVFYLPKERFVLDGAVYKSTYPASKFDLGLDKEKILSLNPEVPLKTTTFHKIEKYKANAVISFETFTGKSDWITYSQRAGVKVIDIPMIEWVNKQGFYGKSYKLFNQVWCLNNFSHKSFMNTYSDAPDKIKNIRWDFVSNDFSPASNKDIFFIHFGATNNGLDVKNTNEVLKAFRRVSEIRSDINFVYVGSYNKEQEGIAGLECFNDYLPRQKIVELTNRSKCVVAPSLREGLGLNILEGMKSGAKIITTDHEPMNEYKGLILCKPKYLKSDGSLVPMAMVDSFEIFNSMLKVLSKSNEK